MATPLTSLHRKPITSVAATPSTPSLHSGSISQPQQESLENAGRLVDIHLKEDASYRELSGQLQIASHTITNFSGHAEMDYPRLENYFPSLDGLPSVVQKRHVPLPAELLQEFQNLECNCSMGLFPEISRAWLTIDSIVYIWNYEDGCDLAYFDGLNQVLLCVGLVTPKEGVFQPHIQYLLVLATAVEVVLLGVCFTASGMNLQAEMHLQPEPLFHLPSDNVSMLCMEGTENGRIFLGGKNGSLYEVSYQAKEGWFSGKCHLVNHSSSVFSYLMPTFLSFSEDDPLAQLVVDSSRQILYSRSYGNTITVYYLGKDGCGLSRVTSMSTDTITHRGMATLRMSDPTLFKPLSSIAVLPASESSTLHLLAITSSGLRMYFTTTPNGVVAPPSLLALVHIRLPPGFSSSSASHRPRNICQVFYRRGTMLLSSSLGADKASLMVVRPDMFPFQPSLLESYEALDVEGSVWAMAESIQVGELEGTTSPVPLPPAVVTQHTLPAREFVVIGTKGSYLFSCLRPVEQLRHLLSKSRGGASPAVEDFFKLHREAQACAMCLTLAIGLDQQMAAWATEAFFKYGGEPEMVQPTPLMPDNLQQQQQQQQQQRAYLHQGAVGGIPGPITPISGTAGLIHPSTPPGSVPRPLGLLEAGRQGLYGPGPIGISTPQNQPPNFGRTLGGAVIGPEVRKSGRHHGMCRFLARLLRPLWEEKIVQYQPPDRANTEEQFSSRYSPEELSVFLEHILSFKSFFERNTQLLTPPLDRSIIESPVGYPNHLLAQNQTPSSVASPAQLSFLQRQRSEASMKEYDSTRFLYQLVVRSYECLSLWRLLCERQFLVVISGLSKDMKERLKVTTFRIFVLTGKELSTSLISSLLSRYSGEVGISDEISSRLRETTPSLFSQNDAVCSKANELVAIASATEAKYDQLNQLRESVKLYCQVPQDLLLSSVCERYQPLRFYEGIVDLCLSTAQQKDAQNFALHYYKSGQPSDDTLGCQAYLRRQECYSCITAAMKKLLNEDRTLLPTFSVPSQPGPPPPPLNQDQTPSPKQHLTEMMTRALHSKDELFHVFLYSWMLSEDLSDLLVEIKTPFVENFLKYKVRTEQDSRPMLDLLWRYYEKNKDYGAAAKILNQLAHVTGPRLDLNERIEYLSRAMMCAKSCNLPTSSSHEGEFLHELEESMEVARIQLIILDTLQSLQPSSLDLARAVDSLNSELMDITKLYEHFAEKFHLAECKLAIVHCAGHHDPTLIESLWGDILNSVLRHSTKRQSFESVRVKMCQLSALYSRSERFFPKEYLALTLEKRACELSWDISSVHRLLKTMGVTMLDLFKIYDKLFKAKDPFWTAKGDPLHLLRVICSMLLEYVKLTPVAGTRDRYERQPFHTCVETALSQYLVDLPSLPSATPHCQDLITTLHGLQKEIQNY